MADLAPITPQKPALASLSKRFIGLGDVPNAQAAEWLVDLADDLRASDLNWIQASSGLEPAVALVSYVMISDMAWVILDGEEPIAALGCTPTDIPSGAMVWMLGSDRMDDPENVAQVLQQSKALLALMQARHPCLYTYADGRNAPPPTWFWECGFRPRATHPRNDAETRRFSYLTRAEASV